MGLDLDARHDRHERGMSFPAAAIILARAGKPVTPGTLRAGKIWPEIAFRHECIDGTHIVTLAHTDGRSYEMAYRGGHGHRRATGYISALKRGDRYPLIS